MHFSRPCGLVVATAAAFVATAALSAESGSMTLDFGALAVGKVTTLSKGHVLWTGAFSGVLFDQSGSGMLHHANVTCPGMNEIDVNAGTSRMRGLCVISSGDNSIVAEWECAGKPGTCDTGTAVWREGSGEWQGMTADVTFTAQLGPGFEDQTVPAFAVWTVNYTRP